MGGGGQRERAQKGIEKTDERESQEKINKNRLKTSNFFVAVSNVGVFFLVWLHFHKSLGGSDRWQHFSCGTPTQTGCPVD